MKEGDKRKSPADEITSPPWHQASLGSNVVPGERAAKRQRGADETVAESDSAIPSTSGESRQIAPPRQSPGSRPDDKDGHLVFELGESITPRYKILSKLGDGTFGRVLECWDREQKQYVAIKVIRNVPKYRDAAYIEIDILKQLGEKDTAGKRHCKVYSYFDYHGHVCMVFERLGMSLYEFLRKNNYKPFKMELVRDFARQMLRSVAFLHNLRLVHTDLKPENILLVSNDYTKEPCPPGASAVRVPVSSKIKLIDFGNATFHYQYHCSVVSTRHYRAPEVVLGLGWTYPCDVWSIGCILLELLTGEALFQTHDNLEHLAMMEAVLGAIPASMAKMADRAAAKYFTVRRMVPLGDIVARIDRSELGPPMADLLKRMLDYDPKTRMTAGEALGHAYFAGGGANSDGSVGGFDGGEARGDGETCRSPGDPAGEGVSSRSEERSNR